jgi:hypothetical protein
MESQNSSASGVVGASREERPVGWREEASGAIT